MPPKFSQRELINDIVLCTAGAMLQGAIMAMMPGDSLGLALAWGGFSGVAVGFALQPIRWLLERRPHADDEEDDHGH